MNLVLLLLRDKELLGPSLLFVTGGRFGPDPVLVHWLEDLELFKTYCQHDPEFQDAFRETLTPEDRLRC